MEPIAALSLASNVIQIADFSARIVSKSSELYKSSNGRLVQHNDIASACADLSQLSTTLWDAIALQSIHSSLSQDDIALHDLCRACIHTSNELQAGLNKLQVHGTPTKWKSLRKALKCIWSKEHIGEMQSRLALYRDEIDTRILALLKFKLDVIELQQMQGFAGLDTSIKALVQQLTDASASIEAKIDQRADTTEAIIVSSASASQSALIDAIEDTSQTTLQHIQSVESQLTVAQTTSQHNFTATQGSRDDIIASIESSSAVSRVEHEQMAARLTAIEAQIALRTAELGQINAKLAILLGQLTSSTKNIKEKARQKLVEETNLLYKILVAKDLMLQKLIDLANSRKCSLYKLKSSIATVQWKLQPYDTTSNATNTAREDLTISRSTRNAWSKALFAAITAGDLRGIEAIRELRHLQTVVNITRPMTVLWSAIEPDAREFYSTIRSITHGTRREVSGLTVDMTALTLTLFVIPASDTDTRCAILDLLISAGADRSFKDRTNLFAYDHARILKLDRLTIEKLYPFVHDRFSMNDFLIDTIRSGDIEQASKFLEAKPPPLEFDKNHKSPISLAVHTGRITIIPKLLKAGFSPFALHQRYDYSPWFRSLAFAVVFDQPPFIS